MQSMLIVQSKNYFITFLINIVRFITNFNTIIDKLNSFREKLNIQILNVVRKSEKLQNSKYRSIFQINQY